MFSLETFGSYQYELDKVDIFIYPSFLAPTFNKNLDNLNTYIRLADNYLKFQDKDILVSTLLYNTNSNDFIYPVKKIDVVNDIFEFKKKLYLLEFNIKSEALITKDSLENLKKYSYIKNLNYFQNYSKINENNIKELEFSSAKILNKNIFKKYNEISFEVEADKDSFIVVNHSYYKYWKAYVDNMEVPILNTNGIVMGVIVPKGKHQVILRYQPWYSKFFFLPFIMTFIYLLIGFLIGKRFNY